MRRVDEINMESERKARRPKNSHVAIASLVVFHHPASKVGDRLLQSPALIQEVNEDGTVNLVFFSVAGNTTFRLSVAQGRKAYEWDWPENVDKEK